VTRKAKSKKKPFALTSRQSEVVRNWASVFGLSPSETAVIENSAVSTIYERLSRGEYDAYKDGHATRITVESIKRRRAGLQRATFTPPKPRTAQASA
jgi:hypothetical protein